MRQVSDKTIKWILIIYVVALAISIAMVFLYEPLTGRVSEGTVELCVNHVPDINVSCNASAPLYALYRCTNITASDADNDTLSYYDNASEFNVNSETGEILWVPTNDDFGDYNFTVFVTDGICGIGYADPFETFSVSVYSVCGDGICTVNETVDTCNADCNETVIYQNVTQYVNVGGGGGGTRTVTVPGPTEPKFTMLPGYLQIYLTPGSSTTESFIVANDWDSGMIIALTTAGLDGSIALTKERIELLPGKAETVMVTFATAGLKEGVYTGEIIGVYGSVSENIVAILNVGSEFKLFDLDLFLAQKYRDIKSGENIVAQITAFDIAKVGRTNAEISYVIKDSRGETKYSDSETVTIDRQLSYSRSFPTEDDWHDGTYVLAVILESNGQISTASQTFEIRGERSALYTFDYRIYLVLSLILGGGAVYMYLRRKAYYQV